MKRGLAFLLLAAVLAGCGGVPQPTQPPPTQTPWIVVVTPTARPGEATATPAASPEAPPPARVTATGLVPPVLTLTGVPAQPAGTALATLALATATRETATPSQSGNTPATGIKYPPPVLLEPPDMRPVSWNSTVLLQWSSVGELAEDEYYHLHLERRPKTANEGWYGDYIFTKGTEYRAEGPFLAPFHPSTEHGLGMVYWWVWVVKKTGEDANGKPIGVDISPFSEERVLVLESKPAGE